MSKCGCGPFEIPKKEVVASLCVFKKVFFYCVTPMPRKREETMCLVLYCIDSTFALQSCVYTQASLVPLPHRATQRS